MYFKPAFTIFFCFDAKYVGTQKELLIIVDFTNWIHKYECEIESNANPYAIINLSFPVEELDFLDP